MSDIVVNMSGLLPRLNSLRGSNPALESAWQLAVFGFVLGIASYFVGDAFALTPRAERWVAPTMALAIAPLCVLTLLQFKHGDRPRDEALLRAGIYATLFGVPVAGVLKATGAPITSILNFYSMASQVITGLLIALVIEAWRKRDQSTDQARLTGVYFILLGLVATLVGSLPWTATNAWIPYGMLPVVVGCLNVAVAAFFIISAELSKGLSEPEKSAS